MAAKNIDKDTIKKVGQLNYKPRLLVVNIDKRKPNNIYENSLKRKGKMLGIEVKVIPFYELNKDIYSNDKAIILKPVDKNYMNLYRYILSNLGHRSIEPKGIQMPTIQAVVDTVNDIGSKQNILIIGRSKELGRPLADKLLDYDHTVMVSHTKTNLLHTKYWDTVINLANIEYIGVETAFLIDVSGTVKAAEADYVIENIGRLTTSYALNRVVSSKYY